MAQGQQADSYLRTNMGINVPKSMPPSFFATAASVFIFLVDAKVEMELFLQEKIHITSF